MTENNCGQRTTETAHPCRVQQAIEVVRILEDQPTLANSPSTAGLFRSSMNFLQEVFRLERILVEDKIETVGDPEKEGAE
jgi:hypothetical protein